MKLGSKKYYIGNFIFDRVMELYSLYTQIFNIHEYEIFINVFILSLKRLTSSRSELQGV